MLKNLDGLVFYVGDVKKTSDFYKQLGFELVKLEKGMAVLKLKEFELHFHDKNEEDKPEFREEALAEPRGSGLYIYIEVEDADKYFEFLKKSGVKPSSEPRDWPWGNREFALRDPDGYKLVFYQVIEK